MSQQRGADALVKTLQHAGVKRIFTLSGNHIMPLFDALFDTGIELIHTRHEAACVHMADAYARLTGETGIALVTGAAISAWSISWNEPCPNWLLGAWPDSSTSGASLICAV